MELICRNLFIDTQYFIHKSFDFDSKELFSLKMLAAQKLVNVYLTDITDREIKKKIQDTINTAYDKISVSDARILRLISDYDDFLRSWDRKAVADRILRDYEMYKEDCGVAIIPSTNISFIDIFEDYCLGNPPFHNSNKKNEFPDAVALAVVAQWAIAKNEKVYFLSGDSDWKAFVNQSPEIWGFKKQDKRFYELEELPELLDAIIRQEQSLKDLTAFSDELIDAQKEQIENYVKDKIANSGFTPISMEAEVDIVESYILAVNMTERDILSVDRDGASYSASFEIKIAFEYEVAEYGPWDNEDHRYIYTDYHTIYQVHYLEESIDIELGFHDGLAANFKIISAAVPQDFDIDYDEGEVFEPQDWWPDSYTIIYGVEDNRITADGSGKQEFENFRLAKGVFRELDVADGSESFTPAEGNKISEPLIFYTIMAKLKSK